MKKSSTHILRIAVSIVALGVVALCAFALPNLWRNGFAEYPTAHAALLCILVGLYVTTIPFFFAVSETFKLLGYIDKNVAFSQAAADTLKKIKRSAVVIACFYIAFVPLLYPIADADDAPGLILVGAALAGAPIVVAVFTAVLEKLLQNAINIQSENELTV